MRRDIKKVMCKKCGRIVKETVIRIDHQGCMYCLVEEE